MPILFYVWVNSGQYVVNIDFQPLGLKRDGKKGGILWTDILKIESFHFHNINNLQLIYIEPNIRNKYTDHNIS
jgi:hypothetical protein